MIYNILNYVLFTNDSNKLLKLIPIGTVLYIVLFCLLYTKYANKIPYLDKIKKNIYYVILFDLFLLILLNKDNIVININKKIKSNIPNNSFLVNDDNDDNDEDNDDNDSIKKLNPYERSNKSIVNTKSQVVNEKSPFQKYNEPETESDIDLPIYKSS